MTKETLLAILVDKTIENIIFAKAGFYETPHKETDLIIDAIEFTDGTILWLKAKENGKSGVWGLFDDGLGILERGLLP